MNKYEDKNTNDLEIKIDENVLSGISAKCVDDVITYEYDYSFKENIRSMATKLINSSKNCHPLHLIDPLLLYDLRLQGLIKSLYDELSILKFERLTGGFQILPSVSTGIDNFNLPSSDSRVVEISHIMNSFGYNSRLETVMFGGTFDRLHYGHKYTILFSFMMTKSYFYLGISKSHTLLANKSNGHLIQPYNERVYHVQKYINDISEYTRTIITIRVYENYIEPNELPKTDHLQVVIFPLDSPVCPADIANSDFVLVVTSDTLKGGMAVNDVRRNRGVSLWPLLQIPLVGVPVISSTRLRS